MVNILIPHENNLHSGILVIRAKDGLNNPNGYTHSKAIKFSYTNN